MCVGLHPCLIADWMVVEMLWASDTELLIKSQMSDTDLFGETGIPDLPLACRHDE